MAHEKIKTTKEEIVDYWCRHEDECSLSVDFAEAHERCWRCGTEYSLERCHIVPTSLGGEDEPSNLVLLCKRCHIENPNVADKEVMWDWLRAYAVPFYDTFWSLKGQKEYEHIYGKSIYEELKDLGLGKEEMKELKGVLDEMLAKTSIHYGHPYLNDATIAGTYRMALKEIAKQRGSTLEPRRDKEKPWWL